MNKHDLPTARYATFSDAKAAVEHIQRLGFFLFTLSICSSVYPPLVVKASGLAAGKGVIVANDRDEAIQAAQSILTVKHLSKSNGKMLLLLRMECLAMLDQK